MKHLIKYNESKFDFESLIKFQINEILSHTGWEQVEPQRDNWEIQLQYNIKDDIYINIIRFETEGTIKKELNYYVGVGDFGNGGIYNYIGSYSDKIIRVFHRVSSDYRRMMAICEYVLPFYELEPSEELIEDIKECFIEIEDLLGGKLESNWGYCNETEFGFFPPFRKSDELCLVFMYDCEVSDLDFKKIQTEFNYIKERLSMFDIPMENVKLINDDWRIIIKIKFL